MGQLNDGAVPRDMLRMLDGTPAEAKALVECGLWEPTPDGWQFHDWPDYQDSAEDIQRERGRKAKNQKAYRRRNRDQDVTGNVTGNETGESPRKKRREEKRTTDSAEGEVPYYGPTDPPPLETSIPRHKLPAGWAPNAEHHAYALENSLNLTHEVSRFRAHARDKGRVSLDWDAAFLGWLADSAQRRRDDGGAPTDRQARILRAEMARAQAADAGNVQPLQIVKGAGA
jgi:hypothetical protein